MVKRILMLIAILLMSEKLLADSIGYHDSLRIKTESKHFIVIHFHDWTKQTKNARYKMITNDQNPFGGENNYAYIQCIDKATGKLIFKKPCPAMTDIKISDDEKYIIGISKIMLDNPYQLVVFSANGALVKKRHITSHEAKLSSKELMIFKKEFPNQYNLLSSRGMIYFENNYYVDYISMNMPIVLGKAWDYLGNYFVNNHLSNNFSETVTNYVYWFYEKNPDIKFNYNNGSLFTISLLDSKQQRIEIKIKE
jgi:hypothetical protein